MTRAMTDAADRLGRILAQENEALSRHDFEAASLVIPAKQAAVAELGTILASEGARAADPATGALVARVRDLAVENQALLGKALEVQERLVALVVRAVSTSATDKIYDSRGAIQPSTRLPPMSLSRTA